MTMGTEVFIDFGNSAVHAVAMCYNKQYMNYSRIQSSHREWIIIEV